MTYRIYVSNALCRLLMIYFIWKYIVNKEVKITKLSMSLKITSTATCIRTYQQLIFTGMRKDIMILILNYPWTSNQKHLWSIRIQRKTTRNFKVQQEWTKCFLEYWLELPLTVYLQLGCTHLDSCPHPVDVQKKCVVSIERIQLIKCHSEVSYSQNVHTIYNREKQT